MNQLVINVGVIDRYMRNPYGPIAKDLDRRMRQVARIAEGNFSGRLLQVQSGDLRDNFDANIFADGEGLHADIGTTAIHNEFGYPRFHDRQATGGKRWLTSALAEGYR